MAIGLWALGPATGAAAADLSADPLLRPSSVSPLSFHLMAARVVRAGGRLVSVGERGTILLSDDQGVSWRQVTAPVSVTLTAVHFPTPQLGWAVGHSGIVLATRDGGETWAKQLDGAAAAAIELTQAKADLASAADEAEAQHRIREAEGLVQDGPDKPFMDVHFFDETHGFIIGAYGLAFRTEDGGRNWISMMGRMDNPRGRNLYALDIAPDGLYVAGEQGSVFKSVDGGANFRRLENPSKGTYFGIVSSPGGAVIAFGLLGLLYRTEDGGAHWRKIDMPPASLTGGTRLSDGSLLLVDEAGHMLRSTDAGNSFVEIQPAQSVTLSGAEEAGSGALVLAGSLGPIRVAIAPDGQGSAVPEAVK